MSLWCSLLGHRFGEATVEREREEREEEVLTVSREVETCERCGARRVVSENTEVTTVDPAPEEADEGGGLGGAVARSEADGAPGPDLDQPEDPAEEDAEILTEESDERSPGEWPAEPGDPDDPAEEPSDDGPAPDLGVTEAVDDPPADTFHCPECGFAADREGSALREGDACPECMEGYLEVG